MDRLDHKNTWAEHYVFNLINRCNFGIRKGPNVKNGTKKEQYYGILAQTVLCYLLHQKLPTESEGYDGGIDLVINNKKVDLKTMVRTTDVNVSYMIGNLTESQTRQGSTEVYLFGSFNTLKNKIELIGFCYKYEIQEISTYIPPGTTRRNRAGKEIKFIQGIYEVDYRKLHQIDSLSDLYRYI